MLASAREEKLQAQIRKHHILERVPTHQTRRRYQPVAISEEAPMELAEQHDIVMMELGQDRLDRSTQACQSRHMLTQTDTVLDLTTSEENQRTRTTVVDAYC